VLAGLVTSTVDFISGIAHRWVGFLPGAILGIVALLGVQVPVALTAGVLGLGLAWAVLMTYHELYAKTEASQFLGTLSLERPSCGMSLDPVAGSMQLQPFVVLGTAHR